MAAKFYSMGLFFLPFPFTGGGDASPMVEANHRRLTKLSTLSLSLSPTFRSELNERMKTAGDASARESRQLAQT